MFKVIDVIQGSDDWFSARNGVLTASMFDRIVTKTGKVSSSWEEAVNMCVAELLLGGKDEGFQSDAMLRGQSLEYEALNFFNCAYDYEFSRVGFLRATMPMDNNKERLLNFGASPDAIDFNNRVGLELKCPLSHTHINYLLGKKLPDKYKHQVQGALLVTGFDKWVFGSYHPDLPCLMVEVERDEEYISVLREQIYKCCEEIDSRYNALKDACK